MTHLVEGTFTITAGEPAWSLAEVNALTPDSKARHRYQVIQVVRNDKLVEWRHDMGDEKNFKARQFNILGGYVDERGRGHVFESVESLRVIADQMRNEGYAGPRDEEPEMPSKAEWQQAYADLVDARKLARTGRKSFVMGGMK